MNSTYCSTFIEPLLSQSDCQAHVSGSMEDTKGEVSQGQNTTSKVLLKHFLKQSQQGA